MNIHKALVVDDSKVAHLTLRKLLTERGIQVDWAGSGEDAITYMEKHRPDIIFMDVMMPGMDGFETTHAITSNPNISAPPVIMCSANATEEDKQNAKRSGAIGFLSKPYTAAQMDQILTMVGGIPKPVIEKTATPPPVEPVVPRPLAPEAAAPPVPEKAAAPVVVAELERVAGDVVRAAAEKAAREVAKATAEQTTRLLAEESGRKAAQAAVQAAIEAAKKTASEVAKAATETARNASEQVAREVSQDIAQRVATRSVTEGRENLTKGLEGQISKTLGDALSSSLASKEFKQQLQQLAIEAVLPKAEAAAREAVANAMPELVGGALKRAKLAMVIGLVGLAIAAAALALRFL